MNCNLCKKQLNNSDTYMIDKIFLCAGCIQKYIDSKCKDDCESCIYYKACKSKSKLNIA